MIIRILNYNGMSYTNGEYFDVKKVDLKEFISRCESICIEMRYSRDILYTLTIKNADVTISLRDEKNNNFTSFIVENKQIKLFSWPL